MIMEEVSLEVVEKIEKDITLIKLINDKNDIVMEYEFDFSEGFNMERVVWLAERFGFKIKNIKNN